MKLHVLYSCYFIRTLSQVLYMLVYIIPGHNAYIGFLSVDLAYNNPVVHVFVRLMADVVADNATSLNSPPSALYNDGIAYDLEGIGSVFYIQLV